MLLQILRSRLIIQDLKGYQLLKEFWEVISAKIPAVSAGTRYNLWNSKTDKTQSLGIRLDMKEKEKTPKQPTTKKNGHPPQNSHIAKLQM